MLSTAKCVFTGVDYLRMTANDHKPYGAWEDILLPEFVREERAGRKTHNRWMLGYYGRVGEHCFIGQNDAGCMIQMSGALAWHRWYDASRHSSKCTRIDLQVTWPLEEEPGEYIREMYRQGQAAPNREGHRASLQLTDTPEGAKLLTVGSRQSELYGRMYDKFRESKMPEYKQCVRWEIEVKGHQAVDLCAWMRENKAEPFATRYMVADFYAKRGMAPFWTSMYGEEYPVPEKRSKTDETKIAWLATQIAPTLKVLKDHGRIMEAVRAMFKDALSEEKIDELVEFLDADVDR